MKKLSLMLIIGWLAIAGWAMAEPPKIVDVEPTLSREQWLERFRNRGNNRGNNRDGQRDRAGRRDREQRTHEVAQYERLELGVDLVATFINPFDPEEIDLWVEFTAPSGKVLKIWGFYAPQPFGTPWKVRFSATETGAWKYVVRVRDREGSSEPCTGEFRCIDGTHHGFVTIAPNKRYLRYSDGTTFFGVGMWYNDVFGGFRPGSSTETVLDDLRERGINFISFFQLPLETFATGLGRYDMERCARLDDLFQWCDERDMQISWNLVFHTFFSETVWEGAQFQNNPYRTITSAKDFYGSEEAWKYEQRLYRYVIARWGYSRALFQWFVIDEINGTDGWEHGDHKIAEDWCRKMRDFFHAHDPYGRPTTGTQSGGFENWWPEGYRIFDIAGREIYEAQGHPMPPTGDTDPNGDHPLRYSYLNYVKQAQDLWNGFDKPAIIAECGWDHTYYEPGTPGYLAMYHNALWSTLSNGVCASPFWWSYSRRVNESVLTGQLRAYSDFVREIDFAAAEWQPTKVEVSAGDGWAMKSDRLIFGWVVNPKSGVANESFTLSGLDEDEYEYDVRLYRTWSGRELEPESVAMEDGKLTVKIPKLQPQVSHANNVGDDVAFKITSKSKRKPLAER